MNWKLFFSAICALAVGASCSPSREVIVVYSPHGPDMLKDAEMRFEAAYPNIELQWIDAGSQEVYSRIKAERSRPQCDVWWGAPSTQFMLAADEGLLEPYKPTWANNIDAQYKDADDRWYGTYRSPLAIMYNTRRYKASDLPQTWDDLLKPEWKGKITLRKPLPSGTMRTFIGAMILRAPSEDAGIAWLKTLQESVESMMENPQLLFDHIKKQEELISIWLMPDVALQRERNGYPFECVIPPQTPVLTEGIAIVKGAPHADNARLFYEFITTRDALADQAFAYAKMPARNDLEATSLPKWLASLQIDPMEIDWKNFAANEKRWCERWDAEVNKSQ